MSLFSKLFGKKDSKSVIDFCTENGQSTTKYEPNIPKIQGDYAKAVFLWANNRALPIRNNDDYPRYLLYECGIKDPANYHRKLVEQGYFEKAPIEQTLNTMKVAELKNLLTEIGQSATGKKDILIKRIIDNADDNILDSFSKNNTYVLSEKGNSFLRENNDCILVHTHKKWNIDWNEYQSNYRSGYSFYDIVWGILNKRAIQDNNSFGRNEYYYMHQLLAEEGRHQDSLSMLLRVLYIDLSGSYAMNNINLYYKKVYTKKDLKDYFDIAIMLAPGIVNAVSDYKEYYSPDIINRLYEQELPIQICDKKVFQDIVESILNDKFDEKSVLSQLQKSYNKLISSL